MRERRQQALLAAAEAQEGGQGQGQDHSLAGWDTRHERETHSTRRQHRHHHPRHPEFEEDRPTEDPFLALAQMMKDAGREIWKHVGQHKDRRKGQQQDSAASSTTKPI